MTYRGHDMDPEPHRSLHERGLLYSAALWVLDHPCVPCAARKRWDMLTPYEELGMGSSRRAEDQRKAESEPHTCHDRDVAFWLEVEERARAMRLHPPKPVEPQPDGWLEAVRRRRDASASSHYAEEGPGAHEEDELHDPRHPTR